MESIKKKRAVVETLMNLACATLKMDVAPANSAAGRTGVRRVKRKACKAAPAVPSIQSGCPSSAAVAMTDACVDEEGAGHSNVTMISVAAAMGGKPVTVMATAVPALFAGADNGAARVMAGTGGTRKLKSAGKVNASFPVRDTLVAPRYNVGLVAPEIRAEGRTNIKVADRSTPATPSAAENATDTHDASGPAGPRKQVRLPQVRLGGG